MRTLLVGVPVKATAVLDGAGQLVDLATDGELGLALARTASYDLVVLGDGVAGGLDVCRRLRAEHPDLLVLMLCAGSAAADRIGGLDAGADDVLSTPVPAAELDARVRALHRRRQLSVRCREPDV